MSASGTSQMPDDDTEGTCRRCGHGIATAHDSDGECWKVGCSCTPEANGPPLSVQESQARKKWQVWADGDCLLTCHSVERAAEYASTLGRGWVHIDIVMITTEATRVR